MPDLSAQVKTLGGFLRVIELEASDAPRYADSFDRLRSGELQALIVHGVYAPSLLEPLLDKLERNQSGLLKTWFPQKFRSWFLGRNLNLADPGLEGYFAEAAVFATRLRSLFPPQQDPATRIAQLLGELDHGRPFVAPPGRSPDERYMFTTLRAHEPDGYIPAHFDNEQALRPSYAHLRGLVELHMTSFVLTIASAEEGGALEVFDLRCDPEEAVPISVDGAKKPDVSGLVPVAFRIPAGSMIILDSGRYLHRVSPVRGARRRWTACSFMALSRRHDAMYCWG